MALYQFRNGIPLTTAAAANFTRGELATALRKVYVLFFFSGFAQFYSSRAGFCFDSFAVLSFRVFVLDMLLRWDMG